MTLVVQTAPLPGNRSFSPGFFGKGDVLPVTKISASRVLLAYLTLVGLLLLASCGAQAPTFEPGSIFVDSEPTGANIFLDGEDTGFITPHTLTDLDPAIYQVSVELTDFVSTPEMESIDLQPAETDSTRVFTLSQTGFRIESPTGARILVDDADTGKIVPAAVAGLEPGTGIVSLVLDGYLVLPEQYEVTIVDTEITNIPSGTFIARSKKTVILEGFSNVSCPPCPQMTENLVAMAAKPEFTSDRMLFIEFSVNWPDRNDPFYLANPGENSDRFTQYRVLGAPDLYVDGVKQTNALDADDMESAVLVALESDPGFLVDVSADFSSSSVPVSVTLEPFRDVDLTGHVLFVAIFEKVIIIDPAPGLNGQTEFHHVFRDRVDTLPVLGALTVGDHQHFDLTLSRGSAMPENYVAIAFVQHEVSYTILQAGSTTDLAP